jgi:hypothetical protein
MRKKETAQGSTISGHKVGSVLSGPQGHLSGLT